MQAGDFMADVAHQAQGDGLAVIAVAPAADADEAFALCFQGLCAELAAVCGATDGLRGMADGGGDAAPCIAFVGVFGGDGCAEQGDQQEGQVFHLLCVIG